MRCESCGANLPPLAATCPFCNATTAAGVAQAREREAWAQHHAAQSAHQQHQAQQHREYLLRQRAQKLPLWGLGALFIPCLGIPALIVFFMAWGVRSEAKRSNLPVPSSVTTAFTLAGISFAVSAFLLVLFLIESADHKEQLAKLEKQVAPLVEKPMLTQPDACKIAEHAVERDGYRGAAGLNLGEYRCDGKLQARGPEKLLLQGFKFKQTDVAYDVDVCFTRGVRWTIDRMVPTGTSCDAPPDAAASGSASGSAAPSSPGGMKRGRR